MANSDESSPLVANPSGADDEKRATRPTPAPPPPATVAREKSAPTALPKRAAGATTCGWTTDGLPLSKGTKAGEPLHRAPWDSGLFDCLGRNDEFFSSNLEVCLLGSLAPCVLYGRNVERLEEDGGNYGTFGDHCLPYFSLCFLGSICLAPFLTFRSRSAIRRKFNLQGGFEALDGSIGCGGGFAKDEVEREQCESTYDLATHFFCHPCALCQEGRELRRRLPHPGLKAQRPVFVMILPSEQTMDRSMDRGEARESF